jgi:hypothetical protein
MSNAEVGLLCARKTHLSQEHTNSLSHSRAYTFAQAGKHTYKTCLEWSRVRFFFNLIGSDLKEEHIITEGRRKVVHNMFEKRRTNAGGQARRIMYSLRGAHIYIYMYMCVYGWVRESECKWEHTRY